MLVDEVEALVGLGDTQDVAGQLMDLLETKAAEVHVLEQLVSVYKGTKHRGLLRVLAFLVSTHAITLRGAHQNLVYELVPGAIALSDASAATTCCTSVQRMAIVGVPWYPASAPPPPELALLLSATYIGKRNAVDVAQLVQKLSEEDYLQLAGSEVLKGVLAGLEVAAQRQSNDELEAAVSLLKALF